MIITALNQDQKKNLTTITSAIDKTGGDLDFEENNPPPLSPNLLVGFPGLLDITLFFFLDITKNVVSVNTNLQYTNKKT